MEGKKRDWWFRVIASISILYFIATWSILIMNLWYSPPSPKLGLNEIGDYLAGAFSPLAFFWLSYGYWMQNSDLKINRETLENQLVEFKKSVEANEKSLLLNRQIEEKRESRKKFLAKVDFTFDRLSYINCHDPSVNTDYQSIDWNEIHFRMKNWGLEISGVVFTLFNTEGKKISIKEIPKIKTGSYQDISFFEEKIPMNTKLRIDFYNYLGEFNFIEFQLEAYCFPEDGPSLYSTHQWDENAEFNLQYRKLIRDSDVNK